MFARIACLDPAPPEARYKLTGALDIYHFLFDSALMRCDGSFYKADDLDLIAELLLQRLPDSMWPNYILNSFLKSSAISVNREREESAGFTKAEYGAFLDRFVASDRPLARVYGRYGNFCLRQAMGEKSANLLDRAQGIVNEAKSVGFDLREYSYFMNQLEFEVITLRSELTRESNHTVPTPRPGPPGKDPTPKSRVSLEPIELRMAAS